MHDKLLNAIRDTPCCRLAYQKPSSTLRGVIDVLQSSVATTALDVDQPLGPTTNYFDLRRHHPSKTFLQGKGNRFGDSTRPDKKCIVCGKPGYWSTNHPLRERMNALRKNKHIKAFVAHFHEDSKDHSDAEGQDAIEDLVAHVLDISETDHDTIGDDDAEQVSDHEAFQIFFHSLSNCAVLHTLTHLVPSTSYQPSSHGTKKFRGILIDTGAARGNTSSMDQYLSYCYHVGCKRNTDRSKAAACHFGNSSEKSQGIARITFPLDALTITFYAHILRDAIVLLLICIEEMDRWGLYFNNIENRLAHSPTCQTLSAVKRCCTSLQKTGSGNQLPLLHIGAPPASSLVWTSSYGQVSASSAES